MEEKEAVETLEISFGTVFEHTFEGDTTTNVIIWVGEKNYCAARDLEEKNGKLFICPVGGTTVLSRIYNILDRKLTLDQIIEGINNCLGGEGVSEEIIQLLTEYSKQPARLLTK